ncbi:helix-hairpin-helix motif [Chloroherpeton thalassium ATCC 35110]|uniref:Helix-hairpin-helix motif n=2 Tax=Chloroherpeton thalassium TaxID=100716 RepID=B3QSZ7_CHLT3|nr:helix-hairpin-helix motif [Chloroherpeton thalassium ATCC 35110]
MMRLLRAISTKLSLTRMEVIIISFLLGFLMMGLLLKKHSASLSRAELLEKKRHEQFIGTELDNVLAVEDSLYEASLAKSNKVDTQKSKETTKSSSEKQRFAGKLNYNEATEEELIDVPGIGPVMAERLVRFRAYKGGRVETLNALLEVKGIGQKKLGQLKNYLKVE